MFYVVKLLINGNLFNVLVIVFNNFFFYLFNRGAILKALFNTLTMEVFSNKRLYTVYKNFYLYTVTMHISVENRA